MRSAATRRKAYWLHKLIRKDGKLRRERETGNSIRLASFLVGGCLDFVIVPMMCSAPSLVRAIAKPRAFFLAFHRGESSLSSGFAERQDLLSRNFGQIFPAGVCVAARHTGASVSGRLLKLPVGDPTRSKSGHIAVSE